MITLEKNFKQGDATIHLTEPVLDESGNIMEPMYYIGIECENGKDIVLIKEVSDDGLIIKDYALC